jgi:HD-GYP domain-containing protein (c-di-GMP phosphodiesterase class II)
VSLTLLVENNPKIESFYALNLSTWIGVEIICKKRADFAIKTLEENSEKIKLIITRSQIEKEQTAQNISEYLKKRGLSIPIIVIGSGKTLPGLPHVTNSLDIKGLIKTCAGALQITAQEMSKRVVPDYYPVPIMYFHVIPRSVCPVYSQDIDDDNKYELRFSSYQDFDAQLVKSLITEGVSALYVNKMDRLAFVSHVTAELISTLEQEELSEDEQISAGAKSVELLSKKLQTIGVTEETIVMAKKSMDNIKAGTKKFNSMSKLIDKLMNNQASYLYKHTQILTYICLHIIRNIDWGTPEQEEKACFICFFHDIALQNDNQCKIHSSAELRKSNLSTEDKSLVERHAQIAAELVSKYPKAPMGSDQIIRQHHGQLNGLGFSEHYGANISPMAVVFIVAEEFTRLVLKEDKKEIDRNEILQELKVMFPTSRFKKILDLVQTITF